MKLLALDSSGLVASAAILDESAVIAEYTLNHKQTHSRTLMPMLDEIARMTELDLGEIDAIAVAAGPGSFTGLRIGAATAKGLGLAINKPLIEVPTLAAMAYQLYGCPALIAPIMDARRTQVYNGLYRFDSDAFVTVKDQRALSVEALCVELEATSEKAGLNGSGGSGSSDSSPVVFLGDGVPVYRKLIDRLLTRPHFYAPPHVSRQRAAAVGAYGLRLFEEGRFVRAEDHVPVYLRKSQAEREREEKPVTIRPMEFGDIEAVTALENEAETGSGWTETGLLTYLMREDTLFLVAEEAETSLSESGSDVSGETSIVGYAGLLMVPEESDVLNIAVRKDRKRRGIATKIMGALIKEAAKRGVTVFHLEVRAGNGPATALYERLGFEKDGIRRNYYTDPVEDAVTMTLRT